MSFTDPRFVEIYEKIDGDRTVDLEFYRRIASEANGTILEAGCGSGRVMLRLLQDGQNVEGFDPSQPMLDILDRRLKQAKLQARTWQCGFDSIEGKYSAVISPFNSMMHLLTQEEQIDAFKRVHGALEAGGVFAFDIANPWTLDIYDDSRRFESSFTDQRNGGSVEIWRWFDHDPRTQTGKYHREFITADDSFVSMLDFRWTYPSEIELLLRLANFTSWEVFGGFEFEPLTEESDCQVWITRK